MKKLLQNNVKFEWMEKCQQSFDKLKAMLTEAPVLVQPESGKQFVIYSNASLNGLGRVLMQEGKVIAYASRQLKPHEKNYPTHDLELAAIVFTLKAWRHHLYGEKRRWLELIKDYELIINYHPGKANVVADALSRKSLFALRAMNTHITLFDDGSILVELRARPKDRVCVPRNDEIIRKVLHEAHSECLSQVKAEHQVPSGLLQPIMVPEWKWDQVTMDFVTGLPLTPSKKDAVWVVIDRLTKSAHFIPIRVDYSFDKLANLYISEIVRLHGVPLSILSDRDPRFTSRFWKKLQEDLGTKLNFSTTFHPQTDGQLERLIQVLEDMLRCCVLGFQGSWEKYLSLVDFTYNNSFQSSLKMAPYEALYGRSVAYRLPVPPELKKIHDVFHVSMLRHYRPDPSHVITPTEVKIQPDMTYGEEPVKVLAQEVKKLRNESIAFVKVLW
ncbi:DNA/RNA polymerases superfamily protein [Gossypium australe]|uniref:DNA/RNA polymerases superfamily protein n=1 Tax=Gossypium australe TaxID=47621 RepID=A0A5B6WRV2_9ROSI|nr:DNA/RNA polymerases superfamily protein [Gossypium australe]